MDDLYGLYGAYFNVNSRPDLCSDNEICEEDESQNNTVATAADVDEIAVLENAFGDLQGKTLRIELPTILGILPRKRKRIDAYNALAKKLKLDKNCELVITSRKTK